MSGCERQSDSGYRSPLLMIAVYDFDFLRTCVKPKLFVSGDRDQFGPSAKLESLVQSLPEPKKLVIIEAADHFFEGRLRELRDSIESWIKETRA